MGVGPTRGATEVEQAWRASPRLAVVVWALAHLVPVAAAYVGIRLVADLLFRPPGWLGIVVWAAQATIFGILVSRGVSRGSRRLLPLATLLKTSLVFPDRAPSRFGVALRSGTVKQMRSRANELSRDGLGTTPAQAAQSAIVLVTGLGRHDRLTRGHTERVRAYADLIALEMGLSDVERRWLAWGVLLHDVGKLTVPAAILNKVGKLTDDEWLVLKNHPAAGEAMLRPLEGWLGEWVRAAGEHHERWDGRGYPRGLEGPEISLAGRITAVADAYDVITSKRSYKEPMSAEAARRELVDCAGSQFDPAVVRAMLSVSIGHGPAVGSLAWITELPVVRHAVAVTTAPLANAVGVAAVGVSAALGLVDDAPSRRQAFAAELEQLSSVSIPATSDARRAVAQHDVITTTRPDAADTVADDTDPVTTPDGPPSPAPSPLPTTVPSTTVPSTTEPQPTATPTAPPTETPTAPPTQMPTAPPTAPPTQMPTAPPTTPPTTVAASITIPITPAIEPTVSTTPSITVPAIAVPEIAIPSISTPEITVPSVDLDPLITTPPVTIPSITTPPITTPLIETPPIQIGGGGLLGGVLDRLLGRR